MEEKDSTEQETSSVVDELTEEQLSAESTEQPETPVSSTPVSESVEQPQAREEALQQKNFKFLREEKERIEREHAQALQRLAAYELQHKNQQQPEEDLEINIGDDDLFEGRHYKKLQKKLQKQEEILKQYQQQMQQTSVETRLHTQFPDFDKVVSAENIKILNKTEPELAQALADTPDFYSKAVSAYKMIKKFGIYNAENYDYEKEIARKNSLKPKPLASVSPQKSESPLTKANAFSGDLTPELKKQLWREMQDILKKG